MKKLIYLILTILLLSNVSALYLDQNWSFADDNYYYRLKTPLNITTLNITSDEVYFDGIPFCDTDLRFDLVTNRTCYYPPSGGSGGSGYEPPEEEEIPVNETEEEEEEEEESYVEINETIPTIPIVQVPFIKDEEGNEVKVNVLNLFLILLFIVTIISLVIWWMIKLFKRRKHNEKDEFGFNWNE